jgi:hypothetical protein
MGDTPTPSLPQCRVTPLTCNINGNGSNTNTLNPDYHHLHHNHTLNRHSHNHPHHPLPQPICDTFGDGLMMMSNGRDDQDNVVENGALEQNSYGFSYGPLPPW